MKQLLSAHHFLFDLGQTKGELLVGNPYRPRSRRVARGAAAARHCKADRESPKYEKGRLNFKNGSIESKYK